MVYMCLEESAFTPEKIEQYKKAYREEVGDIGDNCLLIETPDSLEIDSIEENTIYLSYEHDKIGSMSFDLTLTTEELFEIIKIALNKIDKVDSIIKFAKEL